MKMHEIERRQPEPGHLEITLYLDPGLVWFRGISPYSRCFPAWRSSTG